MHERAVGRLRSMSRGRPLVEVRQCRNVGIAGGARWAAGWVLFAVFAHTATPVLKLARSVPRSYNYSHGLDRNCFHSALSFTTEISSHSRERAEKQASKSIEYELRKRVFQHLFH